jgi:hypothetical protein
MSSHRIHLKGPWDYSWQGEADARPETFAPTGTVAMPRDWRSIFGQNPGTAQFRRKFHRPTNLDPHEHVMLVLTEVRGRGSVRLNEKEVGVITGTGNLVEFEITASMKPFNELVIDLNFDPQIEPLLAGGLYGAVALDIRSD